MIWFILGLLLYVAAAGGCIYGLLVAAWKHTELERPWIYVVSGMLWPVAAAPALGYVLAGKQINRMEGQSDGGK